MRPLEISACGEVTRRSAVARFPRQRTAGVEYHFSNVTPNRDLPAGNPFDGDIAWRLSCRVQ
jgi:hypothetical protein